jgi:hypothetical protein
VLAFTRRDDTIESLVLEPGWLQARAADVAAPRLAVAGLHRFAGADRATAGFVDPPDTTPPARSASSDGVMILPVDPIAWETWRDAWERLPQ